MRQSRRHVLISSGGASFAIPTFDGSHAIFGDEKQGYIELYSSGTLTLPKKGVVDIFMVGGGKAGNAGSSPGPSSATSGAGGLAGATLTFLQRTVEGEYSVTIAAANGNTTINTFGTTPSAGIGTPGASKTTSGSGNNAGAGSHPFGDSSFTRVSGAGGGGACQIGGGTTYRRGGYGYDGGGNGGAYNGNTATPNYKGTTGYPGVANTGGGGGGGSGVTGTSATRYAGGAGGSGIVIIRWGYDAA